MKMRNFYLVAFLVSFLMVLTACASTPKVEMKSDASPSAEKIDKFIIGKTTEAQVIDSIGPPGNKEKRTDGAKLYHYRYIDIVGFMGQTSSGGEHVTITFGTDGVVKKIDRQKL